MRRQAGCPEGAGHQTAPSGPTGGRVRARMGPGCSPGLPLRTAGRPEDLAGRAGAPGETEDSVENGDPILVPDAEPALLGESETHRTQGFHFRRRGQLPARKPCCSGRRLETVAHIQQHPFKCMAERARKAGLPGDTHKAGAGNQSGQRRPARSRAGWAWAGRRGSPWPGDGGSQPPWGPEIRPGLRKARNYR